MPGEGRAAHGPMLMLITDGKSISGLRWEFRFQ
jgi:hypothetical protein